MAQNDDHRRVFGPLDRSGSGSLLPITICCLATLAIAFARVYEHTYLGIPRLLAIVVVGVLWCAVFFGLRRAAATGLPARGFHR